MMVQGKGSTNVTVRQKGMSRGADTHLGDVSSQGVHHWIEGDSPHGE